LDVNNVEFSKSISDHIQDIMKVESTEITLRSMLMNRNILTRLKCWLAYRFVKILFVLSVVLAGKKDEKQ
ncbi:MAG TPA: hypothetical protein PK398_03415, partial [Candidatus Gracilibacteria bacterium]|nr:hypothetical protein [Candidatus Gracilibacteria bacterium]